MQPNKKIKKSPDEKALEIFNNVNKIKCHMASGVSQNRACHSVGMPTANFLRWEPRVEKDGIKGCYKLPSKGGPASCDELNEEETACLKRFYALSKKGKKRGSMTRAANDAALDLSSPLRQEVRDAILKARKNKCYLPKPVERAFLGVKIATPPSRKRIFFKARIDELQRKHDECREALHQLADKLFQIEKGMDAVRHDIAHNPGLADATPPSI
jgi:hypothetical protein